jgi:hypothetical protein
LGLVDQQSQTLSKENIVKGALQLQIADDLRGMRPSISVSNDHLQVIGRVWEEGIDVEIAHRAYTPKLGDIHIHSPMRVIHDGSGADSSRRAARFWRLHGDRAFP